MDAIRGTNVTVYGKDLSGNYHPFSCAESFAFAVDQELKERATVGLGGDRSYKAGFSDYTASLRSVTTIVTPMNVWYVLQSSIRKTGLDIQMEFTDDAGNQKVIAGHAFMPHIGISGDESGFSEDDIQFKFSGGPQLLTSLLPNATINGIMQPTIFYTFPTAGATSFQDNRLKTGFVTHVERDGIGYEVITVGTPGTEQVKFVQSTGTILFETANPAQSGEILTVMYYL